MQSHALRERVNAVEWAGFGGRAGGCASLTRPTVKRGRYSGFVVCKVDKRSASTVALMAGALRLPALR